MRSLGRNCIYGIILYLLFLFPLSAVLHRHLRDCVCTVLEYVLIPIVWTIALDACKTETV